MNSDDYISFLDRTIKEAKRPLDSKRWESDFGNRVKNLGEQIKTLFGIDPLVEILEDSTKFDGFAFPNKWGELPPNIFEDNIARLNKYWQRPAELAISHLGDIASVREDTNFKEEDLEKIINLLAENQFTYVPWEIMKLKSPDYLHRTDTWWDVFFYFY